METLKRPLLSRAAAETVLEAGSTGPEARRLLLLFTKLPSTVPSASRDMLLLLLPSGQEKAR